MISFLVIAGAAAAGLGYYLYEHKEAIPSDYNSLVNSPADIIASVVSFAFIAFIFVARIFCKVCYESDPFEDTLELFGVFKKQQKRNVGVDGIIDEYVDLHNDDKTALDERNKKYNVLVNAYYELATLFYEWGWGQCFHFAYRRVGETFLSSIRRHEYYLGSKLNVKAGSKVLDCGCGVGGPMRNLCVFLESHVTGITLNQYQVDRGNELNRKAGLLKRKCLSVQGDFMDMPFEDNSFDAVYAIEATCHAPDRKKCYSEILRVLKPGGTFACYEWCLTDKYDDQDAEQREIKKMIEEGDGLPDIAYTWEVEEALKDSGFDLVETRDMALDEINFKGRGGKMAEKQGGNGGNGGASEFVPKNGQGAYVWYYPLTPSWNPFCHRFQLSSVGMFVIRNMLWFMEGCFLAPKGTYKVYNVLQRAGIGLWKGGERMIFTPMFLMVGRKPTK